MPVVIPLIARNMHRARTVSVWLTVRLLLLRCVNSVRSALSRALSSLSTIHEHAAGVRDLGRNTPMGANGDHD